MSATGSGKTWLDYAYVIPKRIIALKGEGAAVILGNTQGTVKRNVLEPMQNYHGNLLVTDVNSDNYCRIYGKKVYVLGADNKKHIDRIRGMTIEYAYGDEVPTWNEGVFAMLKSRLRCEHSYFDGTGNPEAPTNYLKSFIDSDVDIFCQTSTIFDNPYLPKEFVNNLCKEYKGTVYYKRYILGEWALAEGLIYPMYESAIVDSHPAGMAEDYCLSIDYGTENPFAATIYGKYGKEWYAVDEYYYSGRTTGRSKTDVEYGDDMDRFISPYIGERRMETIVDPSAASFKTELSRRKRYRVRNADNDVIDGIRNTAVCLQIGAVKICSNCKHMIEELGGYTWDEDETPIKENDHACDELRYFVNTKHILKKSRRNGR